MGSLIGYSTLYNNIGAKRVIKLSKSWEMMMNEFQKRGYEERRGRFNDEYKKETLDV